MSILKPGLTLIHEHTTIDLSRIKGDDDTNLNCFEETIAEFKELYDFGVRNIIDVTAAGMGRNIQYVKEVAQQSEINIVNATGFYKEPFLPDFVYDFTIEQLAEYMVNEITVGIENTDIKAGVIGEIGTSKDVFEETEKKVFEAAVLAHKQTDAIISTHTSLGTMALEQAQFFIERNVDPKKVIIGHQDLCEDLDQIKKLIDLGFNVAFDTIGKNNYFPDTERVKFLVDLQAEGKLESISLSLDITRKTNMKYLGGIGYTYLFTDFIPMLKEAGITDESLDLMLNKNAQRIFGGQ